MIFFGWWNSGRSKKCYFLVDIRLVMLYIEIFIIRLIGFKIRVVLLVLFIEWGI